MAEMTKDLNLNQVAILLSRYQFEMKENSIPELLEQWIPLYPIIWIRLAVVEALYQGRYKVISVEQILNLWLRRGHPTFHFNREFERMICNNMVGSISHNYSKIAQRRQAQTALPSFYQMEQSASLEAENNSASNGEEATELLLETEVQNGNLPDAEENLDLETVLLENESVLLSQTLTETPVTQLTDVKELFAQLISEGHLSEATIAPEELKEESEQKTFVNNSIHEFKPHGDDSALYSKLKAVLQQTL
ncbi:hypothetical protein [Chroococcus sp. FPU101]|uniref:hypothetical protein n=1 Tax=Chroococcus sp. FPU101 TaxID=1974212 RepID=UPI001A8E98AC|nr:hypothetical protein [Chroococcus sp. FPU101]GFE68419.1 hypothetical protein CFPU101_10290 [Chroococcus sp. FPU101]